MKHHQWASDPNGVYRDWLASKARHALRIVEVGVLAGTTTVRMAEVTRGTIWAVDHWRGVPGDPMQKLIYTDLPGSERLFRQRLKPWIENGKVMILKMGSPAAAKHLMGTMGPTFDLIFLDADHRFRQTVREIRLWRRLLMPGGILAGHDLGWPGVKKAVAQEIPDHHKGPGSLWWTEIGP